MRIAKLENRRILLVAEDQPGLYYLRRAGKLIYIGASTDVLNRVHGHPHAEPGDEFEVILTDTHLDALRQEAAEIQRLRPPLNVEVPRYFSPSGGVPRRFVRRIKDEPEPKSEPKPAAKPKPKPKQLSRETDPSERAFRLRRDYGIP